MIFATQPRIIYNDDTCSLRVVEPPHTPERVSHALDYLQGSDVDCLCWCLSSGNIAYSWASDVVENAFDLAARDSELNLAGMTHRRNLMLGLHLQGIDYLPHLIALAHERGLSIFGSFRMNDAHHKSRPHGMLAGTFWREHQQWRLWEVTEGRTYYNACLDYSYPQVRQLRLTAIGEIISRYDFDGIELDWCRNPFAFQPSEAWAKRQILTDFTCEIREMLQAIGRQRGRDVGLMIRVPLQDEKRRCAGMDVEAWVEQGLMDVLVMSSAFNNYDADFTGWADFCRQHGVLFYPSVEAGPAHNSAHNHVTPETVEEGIIHTRAAAQNFLAQEPDGLYMFNYPCRLFETMRTEREFAQLAHVLSEVGSIESLAGLPKRYTFWQLLPLQLESNRPPQFHQTIVFTVDDPAVVDAESQVTIRYRQVARNNPHATVDYEQSPVMPADWVEMTLNGREVSRSIVRRIEQPAGRIASGFELERHELVEIEPPAGMLIEGKNSLAFHIPRYPEETDPYILIYELTVTTAPVG